MGVSRILAFGDSLTEGESQGTLWGLHDNGTPGVPASYPFKLQALLTARYGSGKVAVYNGGYGGKHAREDGGRLVELLERFKPQVVILMEGANDLNTPPGVPEVPRQDIVDALRLMIRDAHAANATVLLSTLPPQRPGGKRAWGADRVPLLNDDLKRIAKLEGAQLVDVYPRISIAVDDPDLTPDGLHLTEKGNLELAQLYFARIRTLFEE